jgi:hypothetical protein
VWQTYSGIDVTSLFRGITTPLPELYGELSKRGWEAKVVFKDGQYVATAKSPQGEEISGAGPTDATAVGHCLLTAIRKEQIRNPRLAGWNFADKLPQIAEAYSKAPVYDPKAAPAWKALADDSMRRAQALQQQLKVEVVDDPEPYTTSQEMAEDVHKNRHIYVSRANSSHPMWSVEQNVAFRLAHDVLGHCVAGGDFGWQGENLACAAHFPLLSPEAQKALFTECIGQTAYGAYYRAFGPQKVAYLDDYMEPAQEAENPVNHQGIHPSQTLAPGTMPQVPASPPVGLDQGYVAPHMEGLGLTPVMTKNKFSKGLRSTGVRCDKSLQIEGSSLTTSSVRKTNFVPKDPNATWDSNIDPLDQNAYLWHDDPLELTNHQDTVRNLDTNWANLTEPDGQPDYNSMKQAIVNSFRAVLLSPRKDLQWNAIHYQDISGVPHNVSDPQRYWDTLSRKRDEWNTARHYVDQSHQPYAQYMQDFRRMVHAAHPKMGYDDREELANSLFFHMWSEEEERVLGDPKNQDLDAEEISRKVAKEMGKRLKQVVKPKIDESTDVGHNQLTFSAVQPNLEGEHGGKYGAFMGSHLRAISQISEHADDLLKAALEDVKEHDGTGHHFRAMSLELGVPGVGPKVASFAWLLLQPMTSQLATIDSHMMDVLGHDYDSEMNPRDYYKFERELAAGRDAAGYNNMPLGQFQWGMWDYKRTGPGSHQDHSAMRPLDPTPHGNIDWASKVPMNQDWETMQPQWWADTQPLRQQVGDAWDQDVATQFSRNVTPHFGSDFYNKEQGSKTKFSASYRVPWVMNINQVYAGNPGETYMQLARRQFGMSTEDVWQKLPIEQFSVGSFDPQTQQVFCPETLRPDQMEMIKRDLLSAFSSPQ